MKRILILFLALISVFVFAQKEIKVDSKVVSATVFKNRALITRKGTLQLPAGKYKIIFPNLSNDLLNESVRVSSEGTGTIKILDVKVEQKFTTEIQQENINELEKRIDSLKQLSQAAFDKSEIYQSKKEFVESLKAQSSKYMNERMLLNVGSTKNWDKILNYVDKNLEEIYKGIREQNRKKTFYDQKINALQMEIGQSQGKKSKNYKEVIVVLENSTAGNIKLYPSYLVQGASWYPLYDARVISDSKEVDLSYFGMIHQSTGEDWKDIALTLSTAEPMSVKSLPELDRWFIDTKPLRQRRSSLDLNQNVSSEYQLSYDQNFGLAAGSGSVTGYVIDKSTGKALVGANVILEGTSSGSATDLNGKFFITNIPARNYILSVSYIGYQTVRTNINILEKKTAHLTISLSPASFQANEVTVTSPKPLIRKDNSSSVAMITNPKHKVEYTNVFAKGLSTSFQIKTNSSIPSDNSQHKVTIAIENLPVKYSYTAIPKIAPSVYLKGKIVNTNNYPFLEGEINVFVDNDFINRTFLKTIVPTDTLELALGIDDKIQIKKVLINKFQESKGLFGGSRQITYDYEIQVTNNRKTEESITIYDQIPIAMNEDINVELIEPQIEKDKLDSEHKLEWDVKLKPREKKIVPIKYQIKFPKNTNVYGLE